MPPPSPMLPTPCNTSACKAGTPAKHTAANNNSDRRVVEDDSICWPCRNFLAKEVQKRRAANASIRLLPEGGPNQAGSPQRPPVSAPSRPGVSGPLSDGPCPGLAPRREWFFATHEFAATIDRPKCLGFSAMSTPKVSLVPDNLGRFGDFGGRYVPETLTRALDELAAEYDKARVDPAFQAELDDLLQQLRRPALAAVSCRAAERGVRRGPDLSQARRSRITPAPTRSTTRSARRCSRCGWASSA